MQVRSSSTALADDQTMTDLRVGISTKESYR